MVAWQTVVIAMIIALTLFAVTPFISNSIANAAKPAFGLVDDVLGTDFSGPPKIISITPTVLKDGRVKLGWSVNKPAEIAYFKIYAAYVQSYKKGEINIDYYDKKFLLKDNIRNDIKEKKKEWTSGILKPGWYKFGVLVIDKENREVSSSEVYVGFFDSRDRDGMAILYDELIAFKKTNLFQSDLGGFIADRTGGKELPKSPAERKTFLDKMSKDEINTLYDKWKGVYVDYLISRGTLESDATSSVRRVNGYLDKAPAEFEQQGMIDISKLK